MKNATFVLVIALFTLVFAGCLMGTPDLDILTGECSSAGDSRVCGNACSQGTQLCSNERNPDGTRRPNFVWSECEGAVECVVVDSGTPATDLGTSTDLGTIADSGDETDAGPVVVDAGPPDGGPIDAGPDDAGPPDLGPTDAGPPDLGPTDAGMSTLCPDGAVRGCSNACRIPSLAGVQVCDPAVGYGECVPIGMSCAAAPPSPFDCPAVGIAASVVIACITPCRHIGWQTMFDYCEDDACRFLQPETCALSDAGPPPVVDAGAGIDAGTDAGPPDLGPTDAGPPDLGPTDAGPPDMGPVDAGPPDLGPTDAGPPDLGPTDAGPPDMGPSDLGPTDAGPPDSGLPTGVLASGAWIYLNDPSVATWCAASETVEPWCWDNTGPRVEDYEHFGPSPLLIPVGAGNLLLSGSVINSTVDCRYGSGRYEAYPSSRITGATIGADSETIGVRVFINGTEVPAFICWNIPSADRTDPNFKRIQYVATTNPALFARGCSPGSGP